MCHISPCFFYLNISKYLFILFEVCMTLNRFFLVRNSILEGKDFRSVTEDILVYFFVKLIFLLLFLRRK